jgi:hypothetical protein
MSITGYKLIQADGNRELAKEVMRFIDTGDGWQPLGAPTVYWYAELAHYECFQAIVKREPESEELRELRWLYTEAMEAATAAEMGQVDAESALAHIAATLVQVKG